MKVVVIGLDSAPASPQLGRWRDQLPHSPLSWGAARTQFWRARIPPITVPAWSCMMTGLDPGRFGFHGFRDRGGYDYEA
jgi:predicted AlkP superfamily phosphohydrolase/phosphomutase